MKIEMDKNNNVSTYLGKIISLLILIVVGTVTNGWALSTIWNWFIPPIFGLKELTLWQAVGVATVLELFTGTNRLSNVQSDTKNKTYTEVLVESFVKVYLAPAMSVGLAWIIVQFAF